MIIIYEKLNLFSNSFFSIFFQMLAFLFLILYYLYIGDGYIYIHYKYYTPSYLKL